MQEPGLPQADSGQSAASISGDFLGKESSDSHHCPVPTLQNRESSDDSWEIMDVQLATERDMFYVSLGDEQIKRTIPFLNEVLRQLVTLNTALMGGSIAFFGETLMSASFKPFIVILFMLALAISLIGVLPHHDTIQRRCPQDIQESFDVARRWKTWTLWLSAGCLGSGLLLALIGIWVK